MYACCHYLEGVHAINIYMQTDLLINGPGKLIQIFLHVLPCVIDEFGVNVQQPFEYSEIRVLDGPKPFFFKEFTQQPFCDYPVNYKVTVIPNDIQIFDNSTLS